MQETKEQYCPVSGMPSRAPKPLLPAALLSQGADGGAVTSQTQITGVFFSETATH